VPARITVTPQERQRLLKFGRLSRRAVAELVSIVTANLRPLAQR
jgi:hypothetical protein